MNTSAPLVSVVLPAYNCAQFLPQAIESILSQTISDFELLVIYDDSTDDTLPIIEHFAAQDNRVRLVHGKKERLVGALNLGIEQSCGKYIARMDADDISRPDRFEKQLALMEARQLDLCGSDILIISEIGALLEAVVMPSSPELIAITLACTVPFAHGSVMMRTSFIKDHHLQYKKSSSAEDYDLWCRSFHQGARFGNVGEFLFSYRHLATSLSKVHARTVHRHTKALRRQFVGNNLAVIEHAIEKVITSKMQRSSRDATFVLLAAYLVSLKTKLGLVFRVAKVSNMKTIVLATAKVFSGF